MVLDELGHVLIEVSVHSKLLFSVGKRNDVHFVIDAGFQRPLQTFLSLIGAQEVVSNLQ